MLNDVAAIHDARRPLLDERLGALENFLIRRLATAPHQHRNAAGNLDDLVVLGHVVGGIRLDDIGAQLDSLADQGQNLAPIAVHHVAARLLVRPEDQRLDHQRHAVSVTVRFDPENVLEALVGHLWLVRNREQIHDHARGIDAQRLLHRFMDHAAEESPGQCRAVHVGHIGAEDERRLLAPGQRLEQRRLPDRELDGVRPRRNQRGNRTLEILDSGQEGILVEKTVVDRHVETAAGLGIEEAVEAIRFSQDSPLAMRTNGQPN